MLAHVIVGEQSAARLWLLRRYARHEVSLLKVLYRLLNSGLMRFRAIDEVAYLALAYPAARWGIAGTPVAPRELPGIFSTASGIAVGPCRCRMAHGACEHPLETDIVIRTGFPVWTGLFPSDYREISAGEALEICRDCNERGMVHIDYAHLDAGDGGSRFVICNCCTDGCLPLLTMKHYGIERYPFRRGVHRAVVDPGRCAGCGTCVEICPFASRRLGRSGKAIVDGCYGCGLCESRCPAKATSLI